MRGITCSSRVSSVSLTAVTLWWQTQVNIWVRVFAQGYLRFAVSHCAMCTVSKGRSLPIYA